MVTIMKGKWTLLIALLCFVVFQAEAANSAINNAGFLDSIVERFAEAAKMWESLLFNVGAGLFWSLATISLSWTSFMMMFNSDNLKSIFAELIRYIMFTGFHFWLLQNGGKFAEIINQSFRTLASKMMHTDAAISPSSLIDVGLDLLQKAILQSSIWSPVDSTFGFLMTLFILFILIWISAELVIILIANWLLGYGGIFLLGFGGAKWTSDIAIAYFKQLFSLGLQTLGMLIIAAIGWSFIDVYYKEMGNDIKLFDMGVFLAILSLIGLLIKRVPPMFSSVVGGFNLGQSFSPLTAAATAMAAASVAGAAIAGASKSIAGGASAVKEAFKAAKSDASSLSSATGMISSSLSNSAKFGMDMGNHLAKGVNQTIKDRMESFKDSTQEKIAQTFGGQVAANIRNKNTSSNPENSIGFRSSNDAKQEGAL